jgi:hypothetical protein
LFGVLGDEAGFIGLVIGLGVGELVEKLMICWREYVEHHVGRSLNLELVYD